MCDRGQRLGPMKLMIFRSILGVVLHLTGFAPHVLGRVDAFPDIGSYGGARLGGAVVHRVQAHETKLGASQILLLLSWHGRELQWKIPYKMVFLCLPRRRDPRAFLAQSARVQPA